MKTPKAPAAPDPVATASAQGAANTGTAVATQTLNMVDQFTPDGSLVYKQIGTQAVDNGLGGTINVPRYSATQTLSPEQEALRGINNQTQQNIATIGRDQSAKIGSLLGKPVNLTNEAVEGRLFELGSKRLDPRFAAEEEALRTRLSNSGIRAGTAAFDREFSNFSQGKNDAFNSLLLSGRGQSVQEILAERNQPINEISALLSGSQVSQPSFVNAPQTQVAGVDYQGAVNTQYQGQMEQWKAKNQQNQALMGGLFGLAGAGTTAAFKYSDRRLKSNIERVGALPNGLNVYEYDIMGRRERGVMSDEVRAILPNAVTTDDKGFDMVNYAMLECPK